MMSWTNGAVSFISFIFVLYWREATCSYFRFGCKFDDKNYNLRLSEELHPAKFGETPEGAPEKIGDLFGLIEKVYAEYLASHLSFNAIDNHIRLYRDYHKLKHCPKFPPFTEFLQDYKITMKDDDEPAAHVLKLMNLIGSRNASLKKASYLITASPFDSDTWNATVDPPQGGVRQTSYWKYQHVAGVIKFNRKTTGRIGYVLLDPKYLNQPVLVMDDGDDAPFKHFWLMNIRRRLNPNTFYPCVRLLWMSEDDPGYSENRTESNFIVTKYIDRAKKYSGPRQLGQRIIDPVLQFAYYFKHPFCSFVEQIVKPSLLSTERTLKKIDENMTEVVDIVANGRLNDTSPLVLSLIVKYSGWITYQFPADVLEDITTKSKTDPLEIGRLCTKLGARCLITSTLCKRSWIKRIKDLKAISMDQDFLNATQTGLDFYERRSKERKEPKLSYSQPKDARTTLTLEQMARIYQCAKK